MSFLSRLFRKAPSPSPVPVQPPRNSAQALPKPGAADRAAATAAEERALQAAIDAGDVQAVARLVVEGSSTKVRQAAAHAIKDADVLHQLIREVRGGNDKGVYKILTTKRDALLEESRRLEKLKAQIEAAAHALERHSQRAYDASFVPTLEQFEQRWEKLAGQADPELRNRVGQWIDRSREIVAGHTRQLAAQASEEAAAAHLAAEAERLRQEQAQASAAEVAERERIREEQKQAQAEKAQAEQQAQRQIEDLVRNAKAALAAGDTARAAGMRRALEKKLAAAPSSAELVGQIQQIDQQLDELKDWKSFSVAPKRAELIEEMESLIGAELDPMALADRIKGLQEEWRTLSRGAGDFEADWQRFQAAGQKAYQPCSEYFAAQALVRQQNLARRDALLATLAAFEAEQNWEQPDWQAVIRLLRETKQEWRAASPVDRKPGKQQQEKFDAVTASLQGRLDAEYDRNVKQKESLIERARQLLASDDGRKAIEAAKGLQQQWRTVGLVPRPADQRLWEEFRQHVDAVFQKRQQESAAYAAGLESNKTQAIALCEQVEKIAVLEGSALLEGTRALGELRSAFEALGEFPRADTRELRNRFERGLDRCEKSLARQRARDAEQSWDDLFGAANKVRAYRLALARGVEAQQVDALKAAAEASLASVPRWPKKGLEALKQALSREPAADLAANEAALRLLCVRAEILADQPTPAEDQPLRREYQLQRLVQSMGQGVRTDETQLDSLALEWVGAGPVDDETHAPLLQRFRRCRERSTSRS